jgi:hypothetical protein
MSMTVSKSTRRMGRSRSEVAPSPGIWQSMERGSARDLIAETFPMRNG